MLNEYLRRTAIVSHAATSLNSSPGVNGLEYTFGRYGIDYDSGAELDGMTDDVEAMMLLYFPSGTIASEAVLGQMRLAYGRPLSQAIVQAALFDAYDRQVVIDSFSRGPEVPRVVEFVRGAFRAGVRLEEQRAMVLRKYQAPLAAVTISASSNAINTDVATPSFVWPWAAFEEMQTFIKGQ